MPTASPSRRSGTPNIVTVVADDMRTDDLRWMPNVRRLLDGPGARLPQLVRPYPLCAPARASLMTGQLRAQPPRLLARGRPTASAPSTTARTIATSLNESGYNTLFLGKYLNGYGAQDSLVTGEPSFRYVPPGWTDWRGSVDRPPDSGYDSGGTYNYYARARERERHHRRHPRRATTRPRVQGRIARRLVQKYHRSPKPFFLYWAPSRRTSGAPASTTTRTSPGPDSGGPRADQDPGPPDVGAGHVRPARSRAPPACRRTAAPPRQTSATSRGRWTRRPS